MFLRRRRKQSRHRGFIGCSLEGRGAAESFQVVGELLFVVLQLEESRAKAAELESAAAKQRLLNVEKLKLRFVCTMFSRRGLCLLLCLCAPSCCQGHRAKSFCAFGGLLWVVVLMSYACLACSTCIQAQAPGL